MLDKNITSCQKPSKQQWSINQLLCPLDPPSPFAPPFDGYSTVLQEQAHHTFFGENFPEVLLITQYAVRSVGLKPLSAKGPTV